MLATGATPQAKGRQTNSMATAPPRMAQSSATPAATARPDAATPSEGIRTVVSFLVFIHLFAVVVGVLSNEIPSELEGALGGLPVLRPYRQLLGMDQAYSFFFTRGNDPGGELDIDYSLVATIKHSNGESETVEFPSTGMWPRQRFHRYQRLANQLAEYASEGAPEPQKLEELAQLVAGGILRSHDAKSLDLRCRGQLTPPAMAEFRPEVHQVPRFRDAYDAHAFVAGDQVELLKKESARDTAPPPKDE
jgi:hypothetical protein